MPSIPNVNWTMLNTFLSKYGTLFTNGRMGEINFGLDFENQFNVEYFPRDNAYGIVVCIGSKGICSETVLKPGVKTATVNLEPRATVLIQGEEEPQITNKQFEALAIGHIRMLLIVLEQINNEKLIRTLDKITDYY